MALGREGVEIVEEPEQLLVPIIGHAR